MQDLKLSWISFRNRSCLLKSKVSVEDVYLTSCLLGTACIAYVLLIRPMILYVFYVLYKLNLVLICFGVFFIEVSFKRSFFMVGFLGGFMWDLIV